MSTTRVRSTVRPSVRRLLAGLVLCGVVVASSAQASHYDFVDVDFLTEQERSALSGAGITATDELIQRAGKRASRAELAKGTGLAPARLLELARICDLLRVTGLGPRMVKLFAAGDVHTIATLRKQDAEALNARLQSINDDRHIAGLVPPANLIAAWIEQARGLPLLLEE